MRKLLRSATVAVTLIGGVGSGTLTLAGPASAAQSQQTIPCGGSQFTIRTGDNNSSDNGGWSVAQIVDGGSGHLIPTSFSYSLVDDAPGSTFTFTAASIKGDGHANANAQQITCSIGGPSTLGVEAPPDFDYAGTGTSPDDPVTVTITITAVHKP